MTGGFGGVLTRRRAAWAGMLGGGTLALTHAEGDDDDNDDDE